MTTKLAEVTTLYETNARNIPEMMRGIADDIEDDGSTIAVATVRFHADGSVDVYGWGDTSLVHAMGLLHLGLQEIGSIQLS
jgi:hypothetical protein